jgi:hypothetical protein
MINHREHGETPKRLHNFKKMNFSDDLCIRYHQWKKELKLSVIGDFGGK